MSNVSLNNGTYLVELRFRPFSHTKIWSRNREDIWAEIEKKLLRSTSVWDKSVQKASTVTPTQTPFLWYSFTSKWVDRSGIAIHGVLRNKMQRRKTQALQMRLNYHPESGGWYHRRIHSRGSSKLCCRADHIQWKNQGALTFNKYASLFLKALLPFSWITKTSIIQSAPML